MTTINRDIEQLESNFKLKVKDFLDEVKLKWFDIMIFEWLRSQARQNELYAQWRTTSWKIVTWTLTSNHANWKAVDIVFKDSSWNPSWSWDYDTLIEIAKKYWIKNLKPKETCHFECDWTKYTKKEDLISTILQTMKDYIHIPRSQIFTTSEADYSKQITAWDIKDLIEIAIFRYTENQKLKKNFENRKI